MPFAKSIVYFAYGSNLSRSRIEARLGACLSLGAACLKGYRLRFHKRGVDASGKCNILNVADDRRRVYGGLYRLTASQARDLDKFEGQGYVRQNVTVLHQQRPLEAYTYIASGHWIDDSLRPYDWYHALVLQGALELGLPGTYVSGISATRFNIDPDPDRRRTNRQLLAGVDLQAGQANQPAIIRNQCCF